MRSLIEKYEWIVVATLFVVVAAAFSWLSSSINGPFIFADEAEYHWLSSEIFNFQKFYGHQYNPLYPLLIAPTFYFNDTTVHFYAIKLINIIIYTSLIFPVYLIARAVLTNKLLSMLLSFIAVVGPISAYSHLVWADPLYYMLICWSYYFIVRYFSYGKTKDIFYAGVFIGLGFLAKQAAILLLISFFAYISYSVFVSKTRNLEKKPLALMVAGTTLIVFPWVVRNTFLVEGATGYSSMFSVLFKALMHDPLHVATEFILGIGYSFGYWIFVYFGAGFFLLMHAAFKRDFGAGANAPLARILLMHAVFLMLASEIFLVAYGKVASANGRYVDVIYPVAVVVIAGTLLKLQKVSWIIISGLALVCFVWLLMFSPLSQVEAYSVVNNSGVSILNFYWPDQFLWGIPKLTLTDKLIFSAISTVLLLMTFLLRKNAIGLICLCGLLLGVGAQMQAVRLGSMSNPINQIFLEIHNKNIPNNSLVIDATLGSSSISYHMKFWRPTTFSDVKFIHPVDLLGKVSIDFGRPEIKPTSGAMKVWAPWNPESGFTENFGAGFTNISTLNGAKCLEFPQQGDFVFDKKSSEYNFHLPPGNYVLRGKSADPACLGIESSFVVSAQHGDSIRLHQAAEFFLPFKVGKHERGLKMILKPTNTSVWWALDEISIERQGNHFIRESTRQYFLSKRPLPLPIAFSVFDYRFYKLSHDSAVPPVN